MSQKRILVVEDERVVVLEIVDRLEELGYQVVDTADSGQEAIDKAVALEPDLILLDIILQGEMDGIVVGEKILESLDVPIIFLTAHSDELTLKRAKSIAPFGYLIKPFEERALHTSIEMALFRHQLEKRVKQSEEWLHTTMQSIGDAVIATDEKGNIKFLNPVAESLTGWTQDEAFGRAFHEVFNIIHETTRDEQENPVAQVLNTGKTVRLANHTLLISRNGQEMAIEDSAAPIKDARDRLTGVVVVFYDVSDRKQREMEMIRNQKLESLGVLAGGIAHDFNNLLAAIVGNISLAKMNLKPDHESSLIFDEIEEVLVKAKKLAQQLLVFSKGGAPLLRSINIYDEIQEAVPIALHGTNVTYSIKGDRVWPVEFDKGQFSQIIHNLTVNAVQAMPDGGVIDICYENMIIGENNQSLVPGKYVKISFLDHGVGISPENMGKIFDPYFSTKKIGSGLGLTTVYAIIKNHDAHIHVESEEGVGTTFEIFIRASEAIHEQTGDLKPVSSIKSEGHILVMDDEETIRKLAVKALNALGYRVEVACNGEEAIQKYKLAIQEKKPFTAVILDLIIDDGLGGKETIVELLKIDPKVRAIVSSGYSDAQYQKHGFCGILQKPYDIEQLRRIIHETVSSNAVKLNTIPSAPHSSGVNLSSFSDQVDKLDSFRSDFPDGNRTG
ncbi:response regulator [candidate division KSB1 bacterium]|nr:response regulator [candidate division KSB1 bacterium]